MHYKHEHANLNEAFEGITQQLFKHIASTRFITREQLISTSLISPEVIIESKLYRPKKKFSLAIPGGKIGRKLLDYWLQKHANNPIWKEVIFHQTNEQYFATNTTREQGKWEEHPFFQAAKIHPTSIHPILSIGSAEKSASLYTLKLPHSHSTLHRPTPSNSLKESHSHHYSPFHCAIICVNHDGTLDSTFEHIPQTPISEDYYTIQAPNGEEHITASIPLLSQVPRLLVLIHNNTDNITHITPKPDFFELIESETSLLKLVDNHPNIHTFSDTNVIGNISEINRTTFSYFIISHCNFDHLKESRNK